MRRTLIAGNWKLNGSKDSITKLVSELTTGISAVSNVDVAVCSPYIYVPFTESLLTDSPISLGAQDVSMHASGAYTGEVAAVMLKEFSCKYCLVGHSERRAIHGESDDIVVSKFKALKVEGLVPVLCVGESLEDRDQGITMSVVEKQVMAVINECGIDAIDGSVIAYEPVWAIGTGRTASPEQAQEVHAGIRALLERFNKDIAVKTQILYGGSMNPANASALLAMQDIDGGLIGGASLKADDFLAICQAA
ncbi:triose-phosphate isomerase [Leucothrix arctica]|uniref:Triosephosphate isomerase n=1 Tax=Leucothrix arctica TaxID=1481894 RepID=A0A317CA66_9GAMM|nr:triose-phosphate isomerase [Leucothrix arctica]PWQ92962.1 triose-phosphate isomerase [Leucothrix arctica]